MRAAARFSGISSNTIPQSLSFGLREVIPVTMQIHSPKITLPMDMCNFVRLDHRHNHLRKVPAKYSRQVDFHGDGINETHQPKAAANLRRMLPADDENIIRIHGFTDDQFTQWAPLKRNFQTDRPHTRPTP